ncbi:MAG TPA: SUMF1/EgtB/PvdO family nonheme iron enzyme [Cyclobacteriaceae bacterium]|nr:SUMF1/EgtB/PvdO family nonheme iron enzyme [Cyclobacteriaceae bacterium]
MRNLFLLAGFFAGISAFAQTKSIIVGDVKDAATNQPLAYATIGVKNHDEETISNAEGKFELSIPATYQNDTLLVTYVGYGHFEKVISQLASVEHVALTEIPTLLDEVKIIYNKLDVREVEKAARIIRGNLYAMHTEVTNLEYNTFLNWLDDFNQAELRKKCEFNLSGYKKSVRDFYTRYHTPSNGARPRRRSSSDSVTNYNYHPAVNIPYEGAVEYCKWLTDRYNENPKRKRFKKVVFRLPTLQEWQIAALGYDKFQSWNLRENTVEVFVAKDSMQMATHETRGDRKTIKVDEEIWFPWYWVYYYRNKPSNIRHCFLGNFRIDAVKIPCPSGAPAYDGFSMMAPVGAYFPNNIGLFDVCGNVAEMINQKGKACGGSWNETPDNSTIQTVKDFSGPDETVGFRIFMEVIEK